MMDELTMKGLLGWQAKHARALKAEGAMWGGPHCPDPQGCSSANRCTMNGACEDLPRDAPADAQGETE